jgi:RimJ/RimL family protein N-acetyltransferase
MPFYPADAPIPEGLRAEEFVLRPLGPDDNALDYEAVMATQETLRLRGNGEWPRPGFTPEENRADLEEHEADFRARRGFTYTVLDPAGTRCLGCVYLYPLADSLRQEGADDETVARADDHEAAAWFWLRPEAVAADLDRRLLAALLPWLRRDFAFARVVFVTWASDERQPAPFRDAGLHLVWSHPVGDTQVLHFA